MIVEILESRPVEPDLRNAAIVSRNLAILPVDLSSGAKKHVRDEIVDSLFFWPGMGGCDKGGRDRRKSTLCEGIVK